MKLEIPTIGIGTEPIDDPLLVRIYRCQKEVFSVFSIYLFHWVGYNVGVYRSLLQATTSLYSTIL